MQSYYHEFIFPDGSGKADQYICMICRTGSMHRKTVPSHIKGLGHKRSKRAEFLKRRASCVDDKARLWHEQIKDLGLPYWRAHMKELLYDHVFMNRGCPGNLSSIEKQLHRYLMIEKTSLLELAAWKASCLWFDGSGSFNTMQDILDHWAIDDNFDPTAYKNERRFTSSVAVILRGVTQFL